MISVILYGRNDSYGYNLHKRAAISMNCIAEVLTHRGDEIIFVDCNTPDDMPTFPEAIQDTLTSQAKKLIRILRLRPAMYEKYKNGSPLKALEPLSRNIAIRRSNPKNRWILSTNSDMVFVVRVPGKSLSDVAAELPDGFYELPRFEIPEALWETVNRVDPKAITSTFNRWGQKLHLNEVIIACPDIRYDGPGDFQLMLRGQIFAIHGFNEEMILGWHVDSNLCRRLNLLNGKTDSLLDQVFSYHCDHTRQATFLHTSNRTENDGQRYVFNVKSPFLNDQAETWGIPNEAIEEIHLSDDYRLRFSDILERLLPGLKEPMTSDFFTAESYNHGQIYNTQHAFPFLADHLNNIPPPANIGYFGANVELLILINQFLSQSNHKGTILVSHELIETAEHDKLAACDRSVISDNETIYEKANIFVFDAAMMHLPQTKNAHGITFPEASKLESAFRRLLTISFLSTVRYEQTRVQPGLGLPRKFLLISIQHTWFEGLTSNYINTVLTPYSSHVRHGYIVLPSTASSKSEEIQRSIEEELRMARQEGWPAARAATFPATDKFWNNAALFLKNYLKSDEKLIAPAQFRALFPDSAYPYEISFLEEPKVQWAIIHKGMLSDINFRFLESLKKNMRPIFANEVFVIFSARKDLSEVNRNSAHYKSFLERMACL